MMGEEEGKRLAEKLFSEFIGEKARNVKLGHGSFITMDFGKDLQLEKIVRGVKKTYMQGEWHLWIIMCAWRLDKNNLPIIGAADERKAIEEVLVVLENVPLRNVTILNSAFDVILEFGNDLKLSLFTHGVRDNKQWMLLTPSRHIFRAGPGHDWYYGQ